MARLKDIRTNETVYMDLETATPWSVVMDFNGKKYTYKYRRGWCNADGRMISVQTLNRIAEWLVCDSSIVFPSGYTECSMSVWV